MSKRKTSQSHLPRSSMSASASRSASFTPSSTLIAFYEGGGRDHCGRAHYDILQWDVKKLESSHDYIQTLFPLPEESGVNWFAPIVDRKVFNAFHSRPELRSKLRESFKRMLWFYGFELRRDDDGVKVIKGANYDRNSKNWDTRFDHNHLRITRIIRSLRVLGLEDEARAFYEALEDATTQASSRSREFWRRAAERDLNIRPDNETEDEEDNSIGQRFLREYEAQRKADARAREAAATEEIAEANVEDKNVGPGLNEAKDAGTGSGAGGNAATEQAPAIPGDGKSSANL